MTMLAVVALVLGALGVIGKYDLLDRLHAWVDRRQRRLRERERQRSEGRD
jgi:hypothetical protein